jgi:hypothetical protein
MVLDPRVRPSLPVLLLVFNVEASRFIKLRDASKTNEVDACSFHNEKEIWPVSDVEAWKTVSEEHWGDNDNTTQIALDLAKRGPKAALHALFNDDPFGVFDIDAFSDFRCPKDLQLGALDHYKRKLEACFKKRHSTSLHPYLWFDHISKAGGSSFCARVREETPEEIPELPDSENVNCDLGIPNQRDAKWRKNTALLSLFMQKQKSATKKKAHVAENEWSYFTPQLLYLPDVPVLMMTNFRFPADWIVSWFRTFHNEIHYKGGYMNMSSSFLKVPKPNLDLGPDKPWFVPGKEGNFQTIKFGGSIPVSIAPYKCVL